MARKFPALHESELRRIGTRSLRARGRYLWRHDHVGDRLLSQMGDTLAATVTDERGQQFRIVLINPAGDEIISRCQCSPSAMCVHALAALWSWVHEPYLFAKVPATDGDLQSAEGPDAIRQALDSYLRHTSTKQLRAIARRHLISLRETDRASLHQQVKDLLANPQATLLALNNLSESQCCALRMLYILCDDQTGVTVQEVAHALGWQSHVEVEQALRELGEWGMVVSVRSSSYRSTRYLLAPGVSSLVPHSLHTVEAIRTKHFDKPRIASIRTISGESAATYRVITSVRSVPELVFLATPLALRPRPPEPEPAQAREIPALREWPYVVDELVRLQVEPGWMFQPHSVLTVPPPPAPLDDPSLALLRDLTGSDLLSDFVSQFLPAVTDNAHALGGASSYGSPSGLSDIFEDWLGLSNWTELWSAQLTGEFTVRRAVASAHSLAYPYWLQQLAMGRRFIMRVLALLAVGQWHGFDSLLEFIHAVHPDFLREGPAMGLPPWWLELDGERVDPLDYAQWRASYGLFVEQILRGPLLWLGAVAVAVTPQSAHSEASRHASPEATSLREPASGGAMSDGSRGKRPPLIAFQITPVGVALLRGLAPPVTATSHAPLTVDERLAAYLPLGRLDLSVHATLSNLGRFERVSENTAVYRFDTDTAHSAFESGWTLEDVIDRLEILTGGPLAGWLRKQWYDWWTSYGKVRWYAGLSLIEFADDYALQELLSQTDLRDHLLHIFGPRLVAVQPDCAESLARQLVKKGYTPKLE